MNDLKKISIGSRVPIATRMMIVLKNSVGFFNTME